MSGGGRYPFWLKNQANDADMEVIMARHEASKEREEKEEYKRQLAAATLSDLKRLIIREQAEHFITPELLKVIIETIDETIDEIKTK